MPTPRATVSLAGRPRHAHRAITLRLTFHEHTHL